MVKFHSEMSVEGFTLKRVHIVIKITTFTPYRVGFPLKNMLSFVSLLERVEIHSFTFRESTIVHFQKVSNLNGVVLSVREVGEPFKVF